jgi:hypothetical protein
MPGPPPKADPVRRNSRVGPLRLPAEGRKGAAPKWPLEEALSPEEKRAWSQLWATPQAVAWERLGWVRTVARYCRMLVLAEESMRPTLLAQVTALEDRLGLTPKSMRMLLWEIVSDEVGQQRQTSTSGARSRIKAV